MGFEHTIQGEVVILLVASCQGNWDKVWLGGRGDGNFNGLSTDPNPYP